MSGQFREGDSYRQSDVKAYPPGVSRARSAADAGFNFIYILIIIIMYIYNYLYQILLSVITSYLRSYLYYLLCINNFMIVCK